jgi:microcystin degradation protein MlrC
MVDINQAQDPLRIGVVGVIHETNSFAPGKTELYDFQAEWVDGESAFVDRYKGTRTSMGGVIDAAIAEKAVLVPGLYTSATPSGMVTEAASHALVESIVQSIEPNMDGLLVILHGAMVTEASFDMEATILSAIRQQVGNQLPLAVTLDLHANISEDMVQLSDIIVAYDTYPHIDVYERAMEAFSLLVRYARGEIDPVMALSQPHLLVAPQAMLTSDGVMKELMDRAFEIEKDPKVLKVSVAGGFPFSDVPDAGFSFVVLTDGDPGLAQTYARQLSEMAWEHRERFKISGLTAEQAVKKAFEIEQGPVILVEGSDNVGGGSPADATHILKYLTQPLCKSLIVIRDTDAVHCAHKLGINGFFKGAVGGKSDDQHGESVMVEGKIRLLFDGEYQHVGPYMTGKWARMGLTAVVESGNLTLVLTENREAPWDLGHVLYIGLRPESFHVIVVKSAIAWKTAFGPIAAAVIEVDTPGCCSFNLQHFTYHQIKRPIYPLDSTTKEEANHV